MGDGLPVFNGLESAEVISVDKDEGRFDLTPTVQDETLANETERNGDLGIVLAVELGRGVSEEDSVRYACIAISQFNAVYEVSDAQSAPLHDLANDGRDRAQFQAPVRLSPSLLFGFGESPV